MKTIFLTALTTFFLVTANAFAERKFEISVDVVSLEKVNMLGRPYSPARTTIELDKVKKIFRPSMNMKISRNVE